MSKFLSGRERELKVGIASYSENKTVLEVVGNSNLTGSISVSGISTFQGNVKLDDNAKLKFGDGQDLQIYHDGSNSYIEDTGTGRLIIRGSSNVDIRDTVGHTHARFKEGSNNNSRVELYYDNSVKFETTGYGVTVAGIVSATSFYGDGSNLTNIPAGGISISTTAPGSPSSGTLWYNSEEGRTFVYYNDGSSAQWVDASPSNASGGSSSGSSTVSIGQTAPGDPSSGDLWYSTDFGRIFVYYDEPTLGIGSTSVWVDAAPYSSPEEEEKVNLGPGKAEKTATATQGQQTFTISGGYTAGNIDVYLNGIRLNPSEFIASNGSTVVLATAANEGDVFDLVEYTMGIGNTGPAGPAAALSIGTRSGVITQNISGIAFTVSLRSGIGTVNI